MSAGLLAALGTLADEWEAEAGEDQAWLNGPHVAVSEAHELPALIRQALAHVAELRQTIAAHQPAEPDDIAAKVERSSLGTPEAQALRATVSDEHAARIVARARELEAHQSERTDTAEHEHVWTRRQNVTSKGYVMSPYWACECGAAQPSEPERGER